MNKITPSSIARVSLYFIDKYRISLLILLILTVFGLITYTSFLKREGFPPINVPVVVVQTPYFVNDTQKVETDVTEKISDSVAGVKGVKTVRTTSSSVYSVVTVEFESDIISADGAKLIKDEIGSKAKLPEGVEPNYLTFEASKIDGKYDLMFAIASDGDYKSLETKANEVKLELEKSNLVTEADVVSTIESQTDFTTGKQIENVAIVIADVPTPEQRRKLQLHPHSSLFGLYEGIPKTKRTSNYSGVLPDKITIFKYPMLRYFRTLDEIREQVRKTVWHEIAHHFGLNEKEVRDAEKKRSSGND